MLLAAPLGAAITASRPNFVILFCDDLGYGDLGCYGHPTIHTPQLDRMAREGMRLTQFYCGASVCTPSRAALLTGRLPIRSGMCSDRRRVLFTDSLGGLPAEEITIAEALRAHGYTTGCIGKWHLGHLPQFLPLHNGFDSFFGTPYSNDMRPYYLIRDSEEIERPVDQKTLTERYTEAAIRFINANKERPFFLYLAHTFPHTPLAASADFRGRSLRGLYGDVVETIDWSSGQILDTLRRAGVDRKTLVVFTSDNGPWLIRHQNGGSAGLLRDGKGTTWEGGMRMPGIFWWPGRIKADTVSREVASTMDLFATFHALAGIELPKDRTSDSHDMTPILMSRGKSTRRSLCYYRGTRLMALRVGPWKAHFFTQPGYGPGSNKPTPHEPPLLYNLDEDPSEQFDVAKKHPDVLKEIAAVVAEHKQGVHAVPSQLEISRRQ
jgi:arylsulfatase A-like enzyme